MKLQYYFNDKYKKIITPYISKTYLQKEIYTIFLYDTFMHLDWYFNASVGSSGNAVGTRGNLLGTEWELGGNVVGVYTERVRSMYGVDRE